jgi:hypothetical protein
MNNESPMPIGAINVPLCFSAANMKMVKTSSAVRNISMKRPCVTEVPPPRFVRTVKGPGNKAEQIAAAVIPPSTCATNKKRPRKYGSAPTRHIPSVTYFLSALTFKGSLGQFIQQG